MDDLIKALQIFKKYMEENGHNMTWPTNCSHDVLYIDCRVEWIPKNQHSELENLGFVADDDDDGWISFRFGSC